MPSSQDDVAVYKDLISFLSSERSDLRVAATEATKQVTDRYENEIYHHILCLIYIPLVFVSDLRSFCDSVFFLFSPSLSFLSHT